MSPTARSTPKTIRQRNRASAAPLQEEATQLPGSYQTILAGDFAVQFAEGFITNDRLATPRAGGTGPDNQSAHKTTPNPQTPNLENLQNRTSRQSPQSTQNLRIQTNIASRANHQPGGMATGASPQMSQAVTVQDSDIADSSNAPVTTVQVSPEREINPSKRRHISQPQYRLIWQYLDAVYGHRCYVAECPRTDLQVDHKDGDRNNTSLTNLQPSCPAHQKVRAVARKKGREGMSEASVQVSATADSTPSMPGESYEIRAHRAEKPFRSWVVGKLVFNSGGPFSAEWFINNGAEVFGVMPITTERYLEKMWSEAGPLEREPGEIDKRAAVFVRLKPEFWKAAGWKEAPRR